MHAGLGAGAVDAVVAADDVAAVAVVAAAAGLPAELLEFLPGLACPPGSWTWWPSCGGVAERQLNVVPLE